MIEKIGELLASLPEELYVFIISILPIVELRGAIPVGAALGIPFYLNYAISILGNLLPVPFILAFIPVILDFLARFKIFRPIVEWLRKRAEKHKGKIIKDDGAESEKKIRNSKFEIRNSQSASSVGSADTFPTGEGSLSSPNDVETGLPDGLSITAEPIHESNEENDIPSSVGSADTFPTGGKAKGRRLSTAVFLALMIFVAIPLPGTGAWTGSLVAALFDLPKRSSFLAVALGVLISGVIMCLASYGVLGFLSFLL